MRIPSHAASLVALALTVAGCRSEGEVDRSAPAPSRNVIVERSSSAGAPPVYDVASPDDESPYATFVSEPEPVSVSAEEARSRMADGALLVCAYEDRAKCSRIEVDGSISLAELEARLASLDSEQEILFYCNCSDDGEAKKRAGEFRSRGFPAAWVEGGLRELTMYR